jgi:hypothetical protein
VNAEEPKHARHQYKIGNVVFDNQNGGIFGDGASPGFSGVRIIAGCGAGIFAHDYLFLKKR